MSNYLGTSAPEGRDYDRYEGRSEHPHYYDRHEGIDYGTTDYYRDYDLYEGRGNR
jgi:hypothetical protein